MPQINLPDTNELEKIEEAQLAEYAMKSRASEGRLFTEDKPSLRTEFQRDRDRIIHCSAFRRLEYKTQVFVNHEGDHYRTRLTHTLEVSQIGRSIGRALKLNETLIEAIVLSHDLGHTPFGHSGEEKMGELTEKWFTFDHNAQSLRVVDVLETRYPSFKGLNLTYEVREGIIKHCTDYDKSDVPKEFKPIEMPTLEAQIVDLADEIAYNNHDLDDGLSSKMITEKEVENIALWSESYEKIKKKYLSKTYNELKRVAISGIISAQIEDLVRQTLLNILENKITSIKDVRENKSKLVAFSSSMAQKNSELKAFLHANLYKHSRVLRMEEKAKRIIKDLFETYMDCIEQIPPEFLNKVMKNESVGLKDLSSDEKKKARIICDYIAGMTDRFAIDEHRKLFDPLAKV